MARRDRGDDIDITKEELDRISEALKKEEFRKLFIDYVEEINDPKNKAVFEKEITQYEKERGIEVTFIHPKPGYVIKTSVDGSKKAFINVCANDKIGKPCASRGFQEGSTGTEWSLPYIQAPPRDDLDKNRKLCTVYDVVFHPFTLELAKKDQRIKTFVDDTAISAVENSFGVKLDKNNLKFPKLGFKGYKHPCVIRKKIDGEVGTSEGSIDDIIPNPHYPYAEPMSEPAVFFPKHEERKEEYTTPKYHIKHRKNLDMQEFTYSNDAKMNTCVAHEILIEISLPLVRSTSDIDLLLSEKVLSLKSESPAKYKLEINLPYSIIENESSAKFDGSSRKLLVTAIVDRRKHCLTKEDSGLESDPSRGMSSSSDEDLSKLDQETPVINVTNDATSQPSEELLHNGINDKEFYLSTDSPEDMDMDISEPFLNPETYYSLPSSILHKISNSIVGELSAKNVEPSSLFHIFSQDNSKFHIKFYSMGSGFVPIHYTAILKLKSSSFQPMSLKTNVYDNLVSFCLSLNCENDNWIGSVCFGRDVSDLVEVNLMEYSSTSDSPSKAVNDFMNQKRKRTGDIVLKLSKLRLYSTPDDDSDDFDDDEIFEDASVNHDVTTSNSDCTQNMNNNKPSSPVKSNKKMRRTNSESGCAIPLIQRRSILKDTRSLSESSANDYAGFSVSLDSEDGNNENAHVKKHVRFNETVSKKVFRVNSSILGQRKKNQRKARNKKKAIERRNSESSGVSESEVSELEVSEVSDLSEVSDVSETSESDDGSSFECQVPQTPGPKAHRRKGKKNHRKSANTAKINCLFHNDA